MSNVMTFRADNDEFRVEKRCICAENDDLCDRRSALEDDYESSLGGAACYGVFRAAGGCSSRVSIE